MQAVEKAGGAVNGVNHPNTARIESLGAGFLANKAVLGERGHQLRTDEVFEFAVGSADHILVKAALVLYRQLIALAIEGQTALSRLACQLAGQLVATVEILLRGVMHCRLCNRERW